MEKYLTRMNEDYRRKYYPNGFTEGVHKNTKGAGNALCVVAIILLVLFAPLTIFGMWNVVRSNGDDKLVSVGLIFTVIGLVFVVPAIGVFYLGKKIRRQSPEELLDELAKNNNYPKSVIQEYMNQVLHSDTYILQLAGWLEAQSNVATGFLTRDFLALQGAIMKRSDMIAACLVNVSETYSVGDKIKTKYVLNIAFLCQNARCVMSNVKKEAAEELTALLFSQNPVLDIRMEYILGEKAFEEYKQETFAHLQ